MRKIAFEKAKSYYLSGKSDSVRKTAKKFNVDHTTLGRLLKTGELFVGPGNHKGKYFTREEENNVLSRAFQIASSGQNLDTKIMKNLIEEEFEVIKVNFPERSEQIDYMLKNHDRFQSFREYFMKKHGVKKYFSGDDKERNFECDICFKRFRFKNSMEFHRKTVHSFLF